MKKFLPIILVVAVIFGYSYQNLTAATKITVTKDSSGNVDDITKIRTANGTQCIDLSSNTRTATFDNLTATTTTITDITSTSFDLRDIDGVIEVGTSYQIDSTATDQGAATTEANRTIKDYVDSVGTSKKTVLVLENSGGGNTTAYTLSTSETIPSNFHILIMPGAVVTFDGNNADFDVDGKIIANPDQQIFDRGGGTGTVSYAPGADYWVGWHGAIGDGSTDDTTAIQWAFDSWASYLNCLFEGGKTYVTSSELDLDPSSRVTNAFIGSRYSRATIQNNTQTTGNIIEIKPTVGIQYSQIANLELYANKLVGTILMINGNQIFENIFPNLYVVGGDGTTNGQTKTQGICLTYDDSAYDVTYKNEFPTLRIDQCKYGLVMGYDAIAVATPNSLITNTYVTNFNTYYIGANSEGSSLYFGERAGNNKVDWMQTYTGGGSGSGNHAFSDIYFGGLTSGANNIVTGGKLNSAADYGYYIVETSTGSKFEGQCVGGYAEDCEYNGNETNTTYLDGQTIEDLNEFDKWNIGATTHGPQAALTYSYFGASNLPGMKFSNQDGYGTQHFKTTKVLVYLNNAQSVTGSTGETVEFDTEVVDSLSEFNTSTYTFTPTYDGMYKIKTKVDYQPTAGKWYILQIRKDGSSICPFTIAPNATGNGHTAFAEVTFSLSAGDDITVYFDNQDDSTATNINASTATIYRNYLYIERVVIGDT